MKKKHEKMFNQKGQAVFAMSRPIAEQWAAIDVQ